MYESDVKYEKNLVIGNIAKRLVLKASKQRKTHALSVWYLIPSYASLNMMNTVPYTANVRRVAASHSGGRIGDVTKV